MLSSRALLSELHPVPRYLLEASLSLSRPSCWANPTVKAVRVFPADAQYQMLSWVKLPKYFSSTILPSLRMINALVFFWFR